MLVLFDLDGVIFQGNALIPGSKDILFALKGAGIPYRFITNTTRMTKNNLVKITYTDESDKTNLVTLEILGMEKTFHKEFSQSSFVETVPMNSEPKYGWSTMPVVFSINHDEFGKIGLKTEIHQQDELKPKVIYSKI